MQREVEHSGTGSLVVKVKIAGNMPHFLRPGGYCDFVSKGGERRDNSADSTQLTAGSLKTEDRRLSTEGFLFCLRRIRGPLQGKHRAWSIEHGAWSKARQEVGRDEDSKAEVETRNVEFFSVLMANGLN